MPVFKSVREATDFLYQTLGPELRLAAPLGLGKPNVLLNSIYDRAKSDPSKRLRLFTALSLQVPKPGSDLEKRFLNPFLQRHFGKDYPRLEYLADRKAGKIPANIEIQEFYMQAGQGLGIASAQESYVSLNYTHVAENLRRDGLQAVIQLIAAKTENGKTRYSLSCNPDLTLDVVDLYRAHKKKLVVIGVVHPDLPFMQDDAEVPAEFFDGILESEEHHHQLFALPRTPIELCDHWIGLHASQLIEDNGTLQIGIGSLSDAVVHATLLRHRNNETYRRILSRTGKTSPGFHHTPFIHGLYGTSEMVMDGFMHLRQAGILKREIFDLDEEKRRYLHGAFYLGSKEFYQWLRDLSPADRAGFGMTRVSKVNDLYDPNEMAIRRQRQRARFFNTCMNVTLLGGAASETLPNGQVVSGVGGQYNFVAMAHELPDARSILLLRSTHGDGRKRVSNIVWSHGHLTIPRHLRDLVVTEYGVADLRGRTDEECIKALIEIADADFQDELVAIAKKNKKLCSKYQVPDLARRNSEKYLKEISKEFKAQREFHAFPFGSDFTIEEQNLALALGRLKKSATSPMKLLSYFMVGAKTSDRMWVDELQRMGLDLARSPKEFFLRPLLLGALSQKD